MMSFLNTDYHEFIVVHPDFLTFPQGFSIGANKFWLYLTIPYHSESTFEKSPNWSNFFLFRRINSLEKCFLALSLSSWSRQDLLSLCKHVLLYRSSALSLFKSKLVLLIEVSSDFFFLRVLSFPSKLLLFWILGR